MSHLSRLLRVGRAEPSTRREPEREHVPPEEAPLQVELVENLENWEWRISERNTEKSLYPPRQWVQIRRGFAPSEDEARSAADLALSEVRERQMNLKRITYHDHPEYDSART
jgi:hypothetical protein